VSLVTPWTLTAELRALAELVAPMEGPKLFGSMRRLVKDMFDCYVQVSAAGGWGQAAGGH
jgi:hypothetical protein